MNCKNIRKKLSAYIDGETDAALSQHITGHLSRCTPCRKEFHSLQEADSFLKKLPVHEISPGFTRQVLSEIRTDSSPNIFNWLFKFIEKFFDLLESPKSSPASLEEFGDFPPFSICKIYFNIL
jgi:hypothetical protein